MEKVLVNNLNVSKLMNELKEDNKNMQDTMKKIKDISIKSNILALNSGIEAARAGAAGRGFAVVATEIKKFAEDSLNASNESEELIQRVQQKANEIIAVRTVDVAFDTIDKIDRNLFERNCDVQAWATFDAIMRSLTHRSEETQRVARALMENIYTIYEVYFELLVLDLKGNVVATAKDESLVGQNMTGREWFEKTIESDDVYVSDLYYSPSIGGHTIAYSCPVRNEDGEAIGVFSTRFNWDFIFDIIERVKLDQKSQIAVINSEGYIIASKNKEEILEKKLTHLQAVQHILSGKETRGYTIENNCIYAYSLTEGYNAYKGKGWSVIVEETIG
ncbi:methyl-accepting chemotaxis protein [Alkalihalobacillus sp. 1P02AB]|uniref:methyl-accepting chemotaxis protein n=1 Tax=Alkalihalobacillus sp. 1P02AB TaxID=3132260 RepID=UPI0039A47E4D